MYARLAKKQNWNVEIDDWNEGNQGGFKFINISVEGNGAYSLLQHESGSHKIQRVSPTDSAKRVHTSAATVVVMPEVELTDITVRKEDVRIDTFMTGGPGGQSQNRTYSGVRLTHLPTNTVVSVRDERSQLRNMDKAWKILYSKIRESNLQKQLNEQRGIKQELRGDGSRGGCIRTYNFPQDRFTDHRVNNSWFGLAKLFQGNIEHILKSIQL